MIHKYKLAKLSYVLHVHELCVGFNTCWQEALDAVLLAPLAYTSYL
jgi:hypothetical protein